jgi:hypothetical protein
MHRLLIGTAFLFATIIAANAATPGTAQRQIKAPKHSRTAVIHRKTPHRTKERDGCDQSHGAYDPWHWDSSYGR